MSGNRLLAIGTDIIECPRIERMLAKHGQTFIKRVFTQEEINYCSGRKMDYQHYAARWAAKEAVLKALGTGWSSGINWTDVELTRQPSGQPKIVLYNRALDRSKELGIDEILISVSHTREFAVAFATAVAGSTG
jgi:holo-[acyl-carrier protein] synthase